MAGHMEWIGSAGDRTLLKMNQYNPGGDFSASFVGDTQWDDTMIVIPEGLILQEAQKFAEDYLADYLRAMGLTVEN